MRLYNPFRWHVVEIIPGTYVVRRRSIFALWWIYSDIVDFEYTWGMERIKYCLTPDREKAIRVAQIRRSGGKVVYS